MELLISHLVSALVGLFVGVLLEDRLKRFMSSISSRIKWRLLRRFRPEPPIGIPSRLAQTDPQTRRVMQLAEHQTAIAFDQCFEILHSHLYAGWTASDIELTFHPKPKALPADLQLIVDQNPPEPPNNGKFRLVSLEPDSSEKPKLRIGLAPTDYFSTLPIQKRLYTPILTGADGSVCSPWEKYGRDLLNFEECLLPNIVCLHVIVTLPDSKLLIIQRSLSKIDWEPGRWSLSFEEQMSSRMDFRLPDGDFFDTIKAGLAEELGFIDASEIDVDFEGTRILSLIMSSIALSVDVVAIVGVHNSLDELEARSQLFAQDRPAEFRRLSELDWTISALAPILYGHDIQIADLRIAADAWHESSRMRMLVALFHRYGIKKTIADLMAWESMNMS